MAEKEDRKSKRFQNTPETRNMSRSRIEHVNLKAPYSMNDKKNPNIDILFDRTLCALESQ